MGDHLTARKFAWLEQIAGDADLRASGVRVGIILAKWTSRKLGFAYPSLERISAETGLKRRAIQLAIDALIERRHLTANRKGGVKDKKGINSKYWIILTSDEGRTSMHPKPDEQCTDVHPNRGARVHEKVDQGCTDVHPTPMNQPNERKKDSLFSPESSNPPKRKAQKADPKFEQFWQHYPRRVGKKNAERAFAKAVKEGADPRDIIAGAMRYGAEREGQEPRYTKYPASWISGGHWEDEPTPPPSPQGRQKLSASEFAQRRAEAIESGDWQ